MSDCGKLLNHVSPVNTVVKNDEGREDVPMATQTSETALELLKAPAPEPTFTPSPTPEPKGAVPDLSDSTEPSSWHSCFPAVNAGNRIANWILNIGIYVTAIVYIGYNSHGCVRLEPEIVHCPLMVC
jgi:hypothetical protein